MQQKYKLKNKKIFAVLLAVFVACYFIRQLPIPFVSNHLMNFALSGGILVVSTYPELVGKGMSKLSLLQAAAFWAGVNIVFEFFIAADEIRLPGVDFDNFNTADPVDALFGFVGIGLFLYVTMKYCTREATIKTDR